MTCTISICERTTNSKMGTNAVSRLTAYLEYTAGANYTRNSDARNGELILQTDRKSVFRAPINLLWQYFIVAAVFTLLWLCFYCCGSVFIVVAVREGNAGWDLPFLPARSPPPAPFVAIQVASAREGN